MASYLAVLGGNALACPAIKHLNELGYNTLVLDGNPSAPAREYASLFIPANFFNFEETDIVLAPFDLTGVMAINDFGVRTASRLAIARGLPGYDERSAQNVTNKLHMKRSWKNAGLLTPRFTWANRSEIVEGVKIEWDDFPCIIKPAFSGGGSRGVFLVHNWEEIRQRLMESEAVYLDDEVIIEEYIQGTEHTIEVLIFNRKPHLLSISDKQNYTDNVKVVQNLYFPGRIGLQYKESVESLIFDACRALGLSNGSAHFEILIRDKDIYLLEVGGRPGGGLNFYPICQLSTGYDYPLEFARVLTGKAPLLTNHKETLCLGWHFFNTERGILRKLNGFEKIQRHPRVVDAQLFVEEGQIIDDISDDLSRPGYFLVCGKHHAEVDHLLEELIDMVHFKIEPF